MNRFYCEEGDIIKFGRVRFKIRKLRVQDLRNSQSIDEVLDDATPSNHAAQAYQNFIN